ncbi:MAG TPA: hypothetical protein VI792_09180, partial [Candidatus Eisenbacteria bacterium]
LLRANVDKLHLLANVLLEHEVLDGDQMNRVLRGEKLEPPKPAEPSEKAPGAAAGKEPAKSGAPPLDPFGTPEPRPA